MFLIKKIVSISQKNSVEELISQIDKRDYDKHSSEGMFINSNFHLVIVYDTDEREYIAKLFKNGELVNLARNENKDRFRKDVNRMIKAEKALSNLENEFEEAEATKFDHFSEEEMDAYFNGDSNKKELTQSEKIIRNQNVKHEVTSLILDNVGTISIGHDDGVIDKIKGFNEETFSKLIKQLKNSIGMVKNIERIIPKEDIRLAKNLVRKTWIPAGYVFKNEAYDDENDLYFVNFSVILKAGGSESYGNEILKISLK